MKFIDAHVHFFDTTLPEGLIWPNKTAGYYQTSLPEHLIQEINHHNFDEPRLNEVSLDGVIAIETSNRQCDDNWLINLAKRSKLIQAVILNLDLNSHNFEYRLKNALQCPKFRGCRLRPINNFNLRCLELKSRLERLPKSASVIELGCPSNQLTDDLVYLANSLPKKRFIVDHFGHPDISFSEPDTGWTERIAKLAGCKNIHCKITSLTQFSGNKNLGGEHYFPTLQTLVEHFGINRILYGSNWPPVNVSGGYKQNMDVLLNFFGENTNQSNQFFSENAKQLYCLNNNH